MSTENRPANGIAADDRAKIMALIDAATQAPVEWGIVKGRTLEEHVAEFRESLSKGRVEEDGTIQLHGVYLGNEAVVCHTGNGPRSEQNAKLITFLFNNIRLILSHVDAHQSGLQQLEQFMQEQAHD